MVNAPLSGNLHRIIPAAVIDNQILYRIDSINMLWQVI